MSQFCFDDAGQALNKLKTSAGGLSVTEARARLEKFGKNELDKGKSAGIVKLFFSQFKDFMTLLLIAAAAVSGLIAFLSKDKNDLTDTFIILAIIFLNAIVGTIQQYRADKAIENLKKLSAGTCKVRRERREFVIPCENFADVSGVDAFAVIVGEDLSKIFTEFGLRHFFIVHSSSAVFLFDGFKNLFQRNVALGGVD